MNIKFQKLKGIPSLHVAFFWKMTVDARSPVTVTDRFIPELFFDYLYIRDGKIKCIDEIAGTQFTVWGQSLRTLYTHPVTFVFSTPLSLYGARLSLRFAESFWEEMKVNCFLKQEWVREEAVSLESFQSQIAAYLERHRVTKFPYPMFSTEFEESGWLSNFSARHKRRLYKTMLGLSRKELHNIQNVHTFLEQTCDFASQNPRIIQHVNPDVFYDQPHLNHTFKKMTGFSPVEYFEANSILQDTLMSASYNEFPGA